MTALTALFSMADTLEARADAGDPLMLAELRAVALQMRGYVTQLTAMSEILDARAEQERQVVRGEDPKVVRLRPAMALMQGGRG